MYIMSAVAGSSGSLWGGKERRSMGLIVWQGCCRPVAGKEGETHGVSCTRPAPVTARKAMQ